MAHIIGVDVGGTFTDAVLDVGDGSVRAAKAPSTPLDYSQGVMAALELLAEQLGVSLPQMLSATGHIAHGTTSSLNALVTGRVARVGLLTTVGHRDSIFIMNVEGRYLGRSPHELQDPLGQTKGHGLLAKDHALEVTERMDSNGKVVVELDERSARSSIAQLLEQGVDAIAVSFLWSFRNPKHERRVRELIQELSPETFVSLSCEVSPRIREFARTATTVMSAQIAPGLRSYLDELERSLRAQSLTSPLLVMQGNGGAVSASEAPATAISTVGSVLSGGVVGALALGRQLGHENIITTDVGGTTFLVGLIVDGEPVRANNTVINHHPINVPSLKVEAIGSGGGAVAWLDAGGNLRVGPQSAQAVPGPACYGQGGTEPTNTDANLVLGILTESGLLGGKRRLSVELAREAIETRIAKPLGLSVEDAAAAIYAIQNAQTGDLLRKAVVESGRDPRDFILYAFGGAGPANCAFYGDELGVSQVLVPLGDVASSFSAYGLACSDVVVVAEISDPAPFPLEEITVEKNFIALTEEVGGGLARQGMKFKEVAYEREIDVRYSQQLAELAVPSPLGGIGPREIAEVARRFETQYARLYGPGTGFSEAGMQAITYRVRGTGKMPFTPELPEVAQAEGPDPSVALSGSRRVRLGVGGFHDSAVYDYRLLRHGHVLSGPAIIEVPTTTVVLPAGMQGTVDKLGNLVIDTRKKAQ